MAKHTPEFTQPKLPFEDATEYAPWVAKHGLRAPYGECQCGCGEHTKIAHRDDLRFGCVKGQPFRFLAQHQRRQSLAEKFWANVSVQAGDSCWEWTGSIQASGLGYGKLKHRGKTLLAHRVCWILHHDAIPDGQHVLHRCDNPRCCRESHLFLGSALDNAHDMIQKGRANYLSGSHLPQSKLTEEQVSEIRRIFPKGSVTQDELGKQFGVTQSTIGRIVRYESYKNV